MMKQFAAVTSALRDWYTGFKWYPLLKSVELYLLFGGLGIMFFREFIYLVTPYTANKALNIIFYTIPLQSLSYHAFLLGAWLVLVSNNVKYLPYALWGYAIYYLFPFTSISLSMLIVAFVYSLLGYGAFKYSAVADELDAR